MPSKPFLRELVELKLLRIVTVVAMLPLLFYSLFLFVVKDVYQHAVVGAVYEILALPMLALIVIVPLISGSQLLLAAKHWKTYPVLSLVFIGLSILLLVTAAR